MMDGVEAFNEIHLNGCFRRSGFGCSICMCPKLRMVYGLCQHRICEDCLYHQDLLRSSFSKCPMCQMDGVFPVMRPDIPEDNIEIQNVLGVKKCPNDDCQQEMWFWEYEEHVLTCNKVTDTPAKRSRLLPENSQRTSYRRKAKSMDHSNMPSPGMITRSAHANYINRHRRSLVRRSDQH